MANRMELETLFPRNKHKLKHVLHVLALLAVGCHAPVEIHPLVCPPPPAPVCNPGAFDKTLLDTIPHGLGYTQYHITMLPAPENSSERDFIRKWISSFIFPAKRTIPIPMISISTLRA